MAREEDRMPATGAGLIRYFHEEGSGIKISPKSVMFFTAGIIFFVMGLHIVGSGALGL